MSMHEAAIAKFPTLRQSRLSTFDRCALSSSFEEQYTNGWSTHQAASGVIFHRFAAKALEQMYEANEKKIPTDAAIAILDDVLRQHDIDRLCPTPMCGRPIVRKAHGRIFCEHGHDHRSDFVNLPMSEVKELRWIVVKWASSMSFDIDNLIDVEQRLMATLRYPDGNDWVERTLTGALDALFVKPTGEFNKDQFVVLDWKSGWGLPAPSQLGFDGYFQQRFYAWLLFKNYPSASRVVLREIYVRFGEPREAEVYREDMEDIEAEMAALAERFDRAHAEQNFPPSPGQHCNICPRPAACPIFPAVRHEGSITDREVAKRIAREITVAEAALKGRKEALAAYTRVHGPEEVSSHKGRRVWGHKTITRTSRPTKDQLEVALAAQRSGVPIDVDTLFKSSQGTRFEMHTPQEAEAIPDAAVDAQLMSALEASVDAAKVIRSTTKEDAS